MITCKLNRVAIAGILLVCLSLMTGCLNRNVPHVTYFSFLTMEQLGETQVLASLPDVKLGIGPITIPDRLKRAQIATRQQGNQYEFDEYHRWAGVLENDLTSVLGENLGQLLGTDKIDLFPWMNYFTPTYRLVIDILRLDGALEGEAVLSARWAIASTDGKESLASGRSDHRQPLKEASFAALVHAESQMIAELSKEIAKELVTLQK